ncbi:hypothetical protein K438DRAFT_1980882 [Mycena galopus ATCC 62051]|nr:hypothetical protein K438DRAFT_1980882 [Mycena galopus ATCC 62051]
MAACCAALLFFRSTIAAGHSVSSFQLVLSNLIPALQSNSSFVSNALHFFRASGRALGNHTATPAYTPAALLDPASPLHPDVLNKALTVAERVATPRQCVEFAMFCADQYDDDPVPNAALLPAYVAILDPVDVDSVADMPEPYHRQPFLSLLASMFAVASIASWDVLSTPVLPHLWVRLWPWIRYFVDVTNLFLGLASSEYPPTPNIIHHIVVQQLLSSLMSPPVIVPHQTPDTLSLSSTAPEVLLTPTDAKGMLRILSIQKIEELAKKRTYIGTSDGPITDESFASILARVTATYTSNKNWTLNVGSGADSKPLKCTTVVFPRSSWAFNIGPGGNFGQIAWKTGNKCPNSIEVNAQPGRGDLDADPCWTKTTRSPLNFGQVWRVQLWKTQFLNPRTAEYAVSGRPIAWETSVECTTASTPDGRLMLPPTTRSIFILNVATQDEGRASEYDDTFKLLPFLADTDLRYNRVPEVLVYDDVSKTMHPLSFHDLDRLGPGLVMIMTTVPTAYTWGAKHNRKADLGWEYRLVTTTIVGRREDDSVSSPSKMVVKRKVFDLDRDDSDNDRPKKPAARKTTSGSN